MATFTLFHEALKFIGDGTIDLDTHTFKAYLSTVAPVVATHTVKADISEITPGNGYTAGGFTLACTYTETAGGSGVWRWNSTDPTSDRFPEDPSPPTSISLSTTIPWHHPSSILWLAMSTEAPAAVADGNTKPGT